MPLNELRLGRAAASGSGGGGGSSKIWMAPPLSTATRRPEGEMATLPPASRTGLAEASSATLPSAASRTSTSCPLISSLSRGARALTGWVTAMASRASREPSGALTTSGQMVASEVSASQSRRPSVVIATSLPAPVAVQVVTSSFALREKIEERRAGGIHLAQNRAAAAEVVEIQQPSRAPSAQALQVAIGVDGQMNGGANYG